MYGRDDELAIVDELLATVAEGGSGALVVHGEPGIGKTSLLDAVAARGDGLRVVRGRGVEFEAELPFAGLHLMLRAYLDRIDALPAPQADALRGAFGLASGHGDRLLVGIAVLTLLADLAEERPLLCLVDDAQWLDTASREALLFAARRLGAEGVAMLFATREGDRALIDSGLPELRVAPLAARDAAALLDARGLEPTARYRVLGEAAGNPLALTELSGDGAPAGAAAAGDGTPPLLSDRLLATFAGQVAGLPAGSRTLLLLAAMDAIGDIDVVLRAGDTLGVDIADLAPVERAGLLRIVDGELTFRHPLLRAAVHQEAGHMERIAAHRALAAALDGPEEASRRAWHLAQATQGTDDDLAAELERTATRAVDRFGVAAAARAYQQAARLSSDPRDRVRRLTLAAEAAADAGDMSLTTATAEIAVREAEPGPERVRLAARLRHVRGTAYFRIGSFAQAYRMLTDGAATVRDIDPSLALRMLTQAVHAAWYAGSNATRDVLDQIATLRAPDDKLAGAVSRYLLTAMSASVGRDVTGLPTPSEAFDEARALLSEDPARLVVVAGAALAIGDDQGCAELTGTLVEMARAEGYLGYLPTLLFFQTEVELFRGNHRAALALGEEALELAIDIGQGAWLSQLRALLAYLAALDGDEERCRELCDAALSDGGATGRTWTIWASGVMHLGLGRTDQALSRLEEVLTSDASRQHTAAYRAISDLVEAAVRVGAPERTAESMRRLATWAAHARQPWIDAVAHRCEALLADSSDAPSDVVEAHYQASLAVPARVFEHARSRLLYGEWLRREQRKADARTQLEAALEVFDRVGAAPWSRRARSELAAAGVVSASGDQPAPAGPLAALTPQELRIVQLAAQGLPNKQIAARLFLSPRTVGYHLYKAYPKLGIVARSQLADVPGLDAAR